MGASCRGGRQLSLCVETAAAVSGNTSGHILSSGRPTYCPTSRSRHFPSSFPLRNTHRPSMFSIKGADVRRSGDVAAPTHVPTVVPPAPTYHPTDAPSLAPTQPPQTQPPTRAPTRWPTKAPSQAPPLPSVPPQGVAPPRPAPAADVGADHAPREPPPKGPVSPVSFWPQERGFILSREGLVPQPSPPPHLLLNGFLRALSNIDEL